jgi:hypothetical protein
MPALERREVENSPTPPRVSPPALKPRRTLERTPSSLAPNPKLSWLSQPDSTFPAALAAGPLNRNPLPVPDQAVPSVGAAAVV